VRRKLAELVVLPLKYTVEGNFGPKTRQGPKKEWTDADRPPFLIPCSSLLASPRRVCDYAKLPTVR
jgi:hypothetical protein